MTGLRKYDMISLCIKIYTIREKNENKIMKVLKGDKLWD